MRHYPLSAVLAASATLFSFQQVHAEWLSDWIPYNGHNYRLTTPMSWSATEAQAVSVGGHLVTINSAAENEWLCNTFLSISPDPYFAFSIGLRQPSGSPEPAGGWQWVSGEPVTYTNWSPGEPNNQSNGGLYEDVVHMVGPHGPSTGDVPRMWNDYPSSLLAPGVVEVVPEPATAFLLFIGGVMVLRRRSQA
jgi:hypothetical protein